MRKAVRLIEAGIREHYEDAPLYDHEYKRRRRDVNFYRRLCDERLGGPGDVLELACGSGRITTALLRGGHSVIGMDLSLPMLHRAGARISRLGRAKRERARLFCGDMKSFALARRFPVIVMGFNAFEHLYTRTDVEMCLERVRAHLNTDGTFAFDVQNPDIAWLCRNPDKRWARTKFKHPVSGIRLEYSTNHIYDPISQIALIRLYYDPLEGRRKQTRVVHLSQRKFFPAELEALVSSNGFSVEQRFGDFEGDPLHAEAESQLLVCRRR
jgi:SAM-dependent methyltransferase